MYWIQMETEMSETVLKLTILVTVQKLKCREFDRVYRNKIHYTTCRTFTQCVCIINFFILLLIRCSVRYIYKVKGEFIPVILNEHHAMKAYWGSESIYPLIL